MVAMWEWFVANGIWVLIVSAIVSMVLLFNRHRLYEAIKKVGPETWDKAEVKTVKTIIWIIEAIGLLVIATALAAVIMSREGVRAMITPETIQAWLLEHGVIILVIILVSYLVYRLLKLLIPEVVERTVKVRGRGRRAREELAKRSHTLSGILTSIAGIIIAIVAIFMILSEVGIDITPLLAGAGVAGIALGLGAQSLIRDYLSGLFIILEDQYRRGDVVQIAGIWGLVEEVNLRRTVMRDLDGTVHSVPNGEVKTASNYTKDWSRVNLNVSVAYGTDLDHAISVINRVGQELAADENWAKMIINAPQVLRVDNLSDSGIDIKILGDVKPMQQWAVTGELRKRIKKAFDEEGIEIPWPHVKLYFGGSQINSNLTCNACSHVNLPGSKFCSNCGAKLSSQ